MEKKGLVVVVLLAIIVSVVSAKYTIISRNTSDYEVLVVITFPSLYKDVKYILCDNEELYLVAPPSIDPHSYQISPRDLEALREADLVISSGHSPLEVKLESILGKKRILDISKIEQVEIKLDIKTGQPNFHLFFLDPDNYIAILSRIVDELNSINKHCTSYHNRKLEEIIKIVENAKKRVEVSNIDGKVIVSSSLLQYVIEWIGFSIEEYLARDYRDSISLRDIKRISNMLRRGSIEYVVVALNEEGRPLSKLDKVLLDIAAKENVYVLKINLSLSSKAVYEIISEISREVVTLGDNGV